MLHNKRDMALGILLFACFIFANSATLDVIKLKPFMIITMIITLQPSDHDVDIRSHNLFVCAQFFHRHHHDHGMVSSIFWFLWYIRSIYVWVNVLRKVEWTTNRQKNEDSLTVFVQNRIRSCKPCSFSSWPCTFFICSCPTENLWFSPLCLNRVFLTG